MARIISRRNMLSLAVTTLGGVAAWAGGAYAKTMAKHGRYQPAGDAERPPRESSVLGSELQWWSNGR